MKKLYFTADIDRDVNIQIPGRAAAGSLDRGSGTAPRFASSERGLGIMLDVLDDLGVRGTFFFEGRTAGTIDCGRASGHCIGIHGYDHEDLTQLSDDGLQGVLHRAYGSVTDNVGVPVCHRAPYMTADDRVISAVRSCTGISVDSSFYAIPGEPVEPYAIGTTVELPVPKRRDASGRTIAAYLWPMHEGKRPPEDYIVMAEGIGDHLVLADHSWHYAESREKGPSGEHEKRAAEDLRRVLEGILDLGFRPDTLA